MCCICQHNHDQLIHPRGKKDINYSLGQFCRRNGMQTLIIAFTIENIEYSKVFDTCNRIIVQYIYDIIQSTHFFIYKKWGIDHFILLIECNVKYEICEAYIDSLI